MMDSKISLQGSTLDDEGNQVSLKVSTAAFSCSLVFCIISNIILGYHTGFQALCSLQPIKESLTQDRKGSIDSVMLANKVVYRVSVCIFLVVVLILSQIGINFMTIT